MALLLMDGFDWISATADIAQQWRNTNASLHTLDATGNAFGGKCIQMTDSGTNSTGMDGIFRELYQTPSGTVLRLFFRIKTNSGFTGSGVAGTVGSNFPNGGEALVKLQSNLEATSNTACWSIGLNSSGFIVVMRGEPATSNARTACAIGAVAVNDAAWHRVEVEITFSATGSVKVWIDGTLDINSTSIDTDDFDAGRGIDKLTTIGLGMGKNNALNTDFVWFDDIVVWDDSGSDFTGASGGSGGANWRIQTLLPQSAGDSTQFTPSSGSNFAAVDDPFSSAADGDSTYVQSGTSGHVDLYNYPNYAVYPATIAAVKLVTRARSTGNGRAQMRAKAKVGANTANGATQEVVAYYQDYHQPFGEQPDGSQWDLTDFSAAQFGFERL